MDPNDPNASAERLRRLEELKEYEGGFGTWALDNVQTAIKGEGQSDLDRLNRDLSAADKAIKTGDTERARTLTGYASDDVNSLQSSKDSLADGAATAAVAVVTTAAVVATGGAATPLAVAGYAALGGMTRAATYYAIEGDAAGTQELMRQGAVGAAEGATTVIPVTKGATALTGASKAAASGATRTAARNTVATAAKNGVKEGALGGAAGGAADAATRSETWDNGVWSGLSTVAQRAAIDGAIGGVTGGVTSGVTSAAGAGMRKAAKGVDGAADASTLPRPSDVTPGSPFGPRPGDVIGHTKRGPIRLTGGASPDDLSNRLPSGVPPWVAKVLPRGFQPEDVSVQGSKVTTGRMNPELNNPKPNTAYWVDGKYLYVTDAHGRVAYVEGTLVVEPNPVRNQRAQSRGAFTDSDGRKYDGDQGGHLIGAQYGGPPEAINYVPQTSKQNQIRPKEDARRRDSGAIRNWFDFDDEARKHIDNQDEVRVRVTPEFIGSSTRPNRLKVEGTMTQPDGERASGVWIFPN